MFLLVGSEARQSKFPLVLQPLDDKYLGAATLGMHISQIRKFTDKVVVYACPALSAPERRSLINGYINFIPPGYQLFVPELAMDLRESVRARRNEGDVGPGPVPFKRLHLTLSPPSSFPHAAMCIAVPCHSRMVTAWEGGSPRRD